MQDWEIKESFRLAKDPVEQIRILADLNMCKPADIAKIVKDVEIKDDNEIYTVYRHTKCYGRRAWVHYWIARFIDPQKNNNEEEEKFRVGFSSRLTEAIKRSGYTEVKTFAKIVGITPTAAYRYQHGESFPTLLTCVKIADVLNCSLDYLIRGIEEDV